MKLNMSHLFRIVLLLCLHYGQMTSVEKEKHHGKTLCSQCQCLNVVPYLVDCDDMKFKEMPHIRSDLKVIWRLRVDGNSLVAVTKFPTLPNLTSISFKYNHISKIEESAFANLTHLVHLDFSHNSLTADSLNSEIFRGTYQEKIPDPIPLQELIFSYNKLTRLPSNMFHHLPHLTTLDLSHNSFLDLSVKTAQAISELRQLQKLNLSYASLRRLPDHFFAELVKLEDLDLSGNNFVVVPAEVNFARSLSTLRLNDNIFGILRPSDFWESLSSLQNLHLQGSPTIYRVDDGAFGNLTALHKLWLCDNRQLSNILPLAFTHGHGETIPLKEVYLQNNGLQYLPENALPWANIAHLDLQGNPWNCDCKMEWLAKNLMPHLMEDNEALTKNVKCSLPSEIQDYKLTDDKVQKHKFVCSSIFGSKGYGFMVVATIVVGTLLLVTGTIIFSYVLFRRSKIRDFFTENVKYRRTFDNEDEEAITSNIQY